MTFDPHLLDDLPPEILAAARTLDEYFREQGVENWALHGVCSRIMYERCKARHDLLVDRVAYSAGSIFPIFK